MCSGLSCAAAGEAAGWAGQFRLSSVVLPWWMASSSLGTLAAERVGGLAVRALQESQAAPQRLCPGLSLYIAACCLPEVLGSTRCHPCSRARLWFVVLLKSGSRVGEVAIERERERKLERVTAVVPDF